MKVIAVDDERLILSDLLNQLKKIPYIESAAGFDNPVQALGYLRENTVDVAFLDINMQYMDGISLAKKIRETVPSAAIIFLTGYSEYAVDACRLHASGYLLKPVTKSAIEEELAHLRPACGEKAAKIKVRAFGSFEVFAGGVPLKFARRRSKELFACLIDKYGASISMEEISSRLWENDAYYSSKLRQIHTFFSSMNETLSSVGVSGVIIKQYKSIAVNVKKIDCTTLTLWQACLVRWYCLTEST